jgi:lysyl-tRNA synthetase class 1
MFWADRIADEVCARYKEKIASGEPLVIRDEKTASGRVHVGSMRGVAVHGVVAQVLAARGVNVRYLYEINDVDPMDDIPSYLDQAVFQPFFGRPLKDVPSPDGVAPNYAEYYGREFISVIEQTGYHPEFYRLSTEYERGLFNTYIRIALDRRDLIREIYARTSGSKKPTDWYPLVITAPVAQGAARVTGFDGEELMWKCALSGEQGRVSPYNGNTKLNWKVEWAAKFAAFGVDVEGAGKDHSTKGGSRDVANHIAREVFDREPPVDIPYEFFLVGGKKMSSSKGRGSSAKEIAELLPPHVFRLALCGKDPKRAIDFIPDGDTIPLLFDEYDRVAQKVWGGATDDDARLFWALHPQEDDPLRKERFLPRFSQIAFLVQMPHLDLMEACAGLKEDNLTLADRNEVELRARYARQWLELCAPEEYRYVLQEDTVPDAVLEFSDAQKAALGVLHDKLSHLAAYDGQSIHTTLHDVKKETGIEPKAFFGALYISFLGRSSGPKAGWFLSTLNKEFVLKRLQEASG